MGLSFEEKKNLVSEVHDYFLNSGSIVAADYTGLTVSQMTDLRKKSERNWSYRKSFEKHARKESC